jgi:hypothetical protein
MASAARRTTVTSPTTPIVPVMPPRPGVTTSASAPAVDPLYPPQMGTAGSDVIGDAPPSYEDAMADDIGPLDGGRVYSGVTDENAPRDVEEKGNGAVPGYSALPEGGAGGRTGGGGFVA